MSGLILFPLFAFLDFQDGDRLFLADSSTKVCVNWAYLRSSGNCYYVLHSNVLFYNITIEVNNYSTNSRQQFGKCQKSGGQYYYHYYCE